MFYPDTNRTLTQLLLSLWSGSTRRVEALPKVREYMPTEIVTETTYRNRHPLAPVTIPGMEPAFSWEAL